MFFLLYILKYYSKFKNIFLIAYAIRLVLLFVDYYNFFPILHSGLDTEGFHRMSVSNASNKSFANILTNYVYFISGFYMFLGECRLIVQYINVLFGMGVLCYLLKIFNTININDNLKKTLLLIVAIYPNLIIFSSILLREAWCQFFITCSLFYFIKWMKDGALLSFVLAVIAVLVASVMHSGCVFLILGYLIAFGFYNPKNKKNKKIVAATFSFSLMAVFLLFIFLSADVFTHHFNHLNEITLNDGLYMFESDGKSAYLTWINPTNITQIIFFAPLKMFYFLFSPLPFDWRGLNDIIAFFLDSVFFIYFLCVIVKNNRFVNNSFSKNTVRYLMISFVFLVFIFGYGTTTSGTAIRHRCKILPLVIVVFSISVSERKERTYYYI